MNRTPRLEGMHATTASETGWIENRSGQGPACMFCGQVPPKFKPLHTGWTPTMRRLWWCPPCETTWIE